MFLLINIVFFFDIVGISCGLVDESNIFRWQVTITGPDDSPYAEGLFQAILEFNDEYPNQPPKMQFTSEMWHPNSLNFFTVELS